MVTLSKDSVCTSRLAVAIRALNADYVPGTDNFPCKTYATRANAKRHAAAMAEKVRADLGVDVHVTIVRFGYWGTGPKPGPGVVNALGRFVPMFDITGALEAGAGGYVCRAAAAGFVQY